MTRYQDIDGVLTPFEDESILDVALEFSPPDIDTYRLAIQTLVDQTAQQRNYDSGLTCASYVGSTNSVWAAEAAAFVAWRDAVWAYAYAELAKVQAGERDQPDIAAFVAELPEMDWPAA